MKVSFTRRLVIELDEEEEILQLCNFLRNAKKMGYVSEYDDGVVHQLIAALKVYK